jgi:hypothetical protein
MAVTGLNRPDFRTISEFRKRHLAALSGLLVQVLRLCQAAGLVKLGDVAVDGSKLEANASKHKAMSYQHMVSQERTLAAEVQACLDQAAAAEAAEDAEHGEARGDETPPDRAQRNVTDPGDRRSATGHSRIMPSGGDFIAGDNGQVAVDAANQVIVAQPLSTNPADDAALTPLVEQSCANLGRKPREVSADSGFATEANLAAMAERGVRADLSPGRIRHGNTDPTAGGETAAAHAGHGRDHPPRRPTQPLPPAQTGGRAGVRPHQAGQRLPTIPPPRPHQAPRRMGHDLHRWGC